MPPVHYQEDAFPPEDRLDWSVIIPLIGPASAAVARYDVRGHGKSPGEYRQAAVLHAEFEALHPFLDGNGRLGRMLVPLFLWSVDMIRQPTFYISAYFESRREAYYERLLAVSRDDDWTGWCRFFLEAVGPSGPATAARVPS